MRGFKNYFHHTKIIIKNIPEDMSSYLLLKIVHYQTGLRVHTCAYIYILEILRKRMLWLNRIL